MAQWCAGPDKRLPYPRGNWYEDQTWNTLPLQAMKIVLLADRVFGKPGEEWEDLEINFFDWMWDAVLLHDALNKPPTELTDEDNRLLAQAEQILQKEREYLNG